MLKDLKASHDRLEGSVSSKQREIEHLKESNFKLESDRSLNLNKVHIRRD